MKISKNDYYEILGLSPGAKLEDIKKAFRKLAFQYHPDYSRDEESIKKFRCIVEAYEVLSDPSKRKSYENFQGRSASNTSQRDDSFYDSGNPIGIIFDDFFDGISSMHRRSSCQESEPHHSLEISFEEAFFGCQKPIELIYTQKCFVCDGAGSVKDSVQRCPECNGTGHMRRMQRDMFGAFANRSTCMQCGGKGIINAQDCPQCFGIGLERKRYVLQAVVPPGTQDGYQMNLAVDEEFALDEVDRKMRVVILVRQHRCLRRQGNDVVCELPISFTQATLGDSVNVTSMDGIVSLKIPPGTQSGQVFRLCGKGPVLLDGSERGDQLINVRVLTPCQLTDKQRELFQELAATMNNAKAYCRERRDMAVESDRLVR